MRRRQPLPRLWLMTDERLEPGLRAAVRRLPRGSGVVFRHHATPMSGRRARWAAVRRIARARRLILIRAGPIPLPGEAGAHNATNTRGLKTGSAHDRPEAIRRHRAGCDLVFVSPIFPTRSHPGARTLGPVRAAGIARGLPVSPIALGGMNARRFRRLKPLGFDGWAAIDAWAGDQKRNAVPT